jgi:ribonuclease P protein component
MRSATNVQQVRANSPALSGAREHSAPTDLATQAHIGVSAAVPARRGAARFGRERRLRSTSDFARVRRVGRSVSSALLTLGYARCAPSTDGASPQPVVPTRVGFTVGKRVGDAVTRNRVRRRLRETMRHRWQVIAPGWDLVVIARSQAAAADSAALAHDLDTLLSRAKVLATGSERHTI